MIWARSAWGHWWTWSPRLTFSFLLWLLYAVYLVLRPSIDSPERRALVCSVYAVVAFLDVPLVYLSVKLLPDIHPSSISLAPAMRHTLIFWFVPITLLCAGLIGARFSLSRRLASADADIAPGPAPLAHAAGTRS
jgi:heme exporter protein C